MRFARQLAAVSAVALLAGCASGVPQTKMAVPTNQPQLVKQLKAEAELSPAETFVEVDENFLAPRPAEDDGDLLPVTLVGGNGTLFSEAQKVSVADAIAMLAQPLGIEVAPDAAATSTTLRLSLSQPRPFADVLAIIREQTGVDWIYKHGFLRLVSSKAYSVITSGQSGLGDDLVKQLPLLGAEDKSVAYNKSSGEVTYRASAQAQQRITRTLSLLRSDSANVTMEATFFQVDLTRNAGTGVTFGNGVSTASSSVQTAVVAGMGLAGSTSIAGAVVPLVTNLVMDKLMQSMLQSGDVRTLQKPSLTVRSGDGGELSNTSVTPFISNISSGAATTTGLMTNGGVNFDKVETGLKLKVNSAAYHGGAVSLDIEMSDKEITGEQTMTIPGSTSSATPTVTPTTSSSGTSVAVSTPTSTSSTIQQPITSEPKTSTKVTMRPGDLLRISGFIKTQETENREGWSKLDTSLSGAGVRSELVVFVRVVVQRLCAKGSCPIAPGVK